MVISIAQKVLFHKIFGTFSEGNFVHIHCLIGFKTVNNNQSFEYALIDQTLLSINFITTFEILIFDGILLILYIRYLKGECINDI